MRRARHQAFERGRGCTCRARDAEVKHLGPPAPRKEDVGRLDVAMNHAACMRIGQRVGDAPHQQRGALGRGPPALGEGVAHVLAVQPLHRDVDPLRGQPGVVHGDDVAVVQPTGGARFVEEQAVERQARRRIDVEVQCLHRHRARQQRVPGFVHRTEPAFGEPPLQRIAANVRQRGQPGELVLVARRVRTEVGEDIRHVGVGRGSVGRPPFTGWRRRRKFGRQERRQHALGVGVQRVGCHGGQLRARPARRRIKTPGLTPGLTACHVFAMNAAAVRPQHGGVSA